MDIFNEYIVKRKNGPKEMLIIASMIVGGIIGMFAIYMLSAMVAFLRPFGLLLIFGVGYLVYIGISQQNVEFEYIVTNSDLDIDRIVARRKRKRIVSIDCKKFEIFAPYNEKYSHSYNDTTITKKIYAQSNVHPDRTFFAVFQYNNDKCLLVFEPTDKMITAFERFVPRYNFNIE